MKEPAGPGILSVNLLREAQLTWLKSSWFGAESQDDETFLGLRLGIMENMEDSTNLHGKNNIPVDFPSRYNPDMVAQGGRRTPVWPSKKNGERSSKRRWKGLRSLKGKIDSSKKGLKPKRESLQLEFQGDQ